MYPSFGSCCLRIHGIFLKSSLENRSPLLVHTTKPSLLEENALRERNLFFEVSLEKHEHGSVVLAFVPICAAKYRGVD